MIFMGCKKNNLQNTSPFNKAKKNDSTAITKKKSHSDPLKVPIKKKI